MVGIPFYKAVGETSEKSREVEKVRHGKTSSGNKILMLYLKKKFRRLAQMKKRTSVKIILK